MKFLREFETESAYNAEKDNLDLPNVSHVVESQNNYFHPILPRDYSREYLTYEVLEDGLLGLAFRKEGDAPDIVVSYSINDGEWSTLPIIDWEDTSSCIEVTEGDVIRFKGNNNAFNYFDDETEDNSKGQILLYDSTLENPIEINVYGNIMSVIYGDNFIGQTSFPNGSRDNLDGFFNWTGVIDASNLILPATALTEFCYAYMFDSCSSLVTAPSELPALSLANNCYECMFNGCSSLVNAPELPATTLAECCYYLMFVDCTSLVDAPELPATTLANSCYAKMFTGCTSLVTAPELPATTLANSCYESMFYGCSSLINAPELPATTLVDGCYAFMFHNCTSLLTAPELPATTFPNSFSFGPYEEMFAWCTSLNYVKCLISDYSAGPTHTWNWLQGVSANGTFVKASDMEWWTTGVSGIPNGWTVVDAS